DNLNEINYRIYNSIGQQVYTNKFQPNQLGNNSFDLEKFSVSGGVYFLEISQSQKKEVIKLVMLK
ncbi:MAG TPA: T9SS type A sorting domain-containing protein, partial [Ignavibacteriaceae bacterium]|nr:T9SS type A sorting domain-containing protein [Ignavibacteriaceae bacterium]